MGKLNLAILKKHFPLVLLVLVNLILGVWALPGFGESQDELSQHAYGERTLQAVRSLVSTGRWPAYFTEEEPKQGSHGPAFIMAVTLLRELFLPGGTSAQRLQFSHFLYFLTFQAGTVALFFLARRWVSQPAAFGTALLFTTQPLLVGHAFMNPKDVVFMSLLIVSAALGLRTIDKEEEAFQPGGHPLTEALRSFFHQFLRPDVWLAGLVLGFSSAVRIAAPLIGVVILVDILFKRKWQVLPRFVAYGLIAFGFMFLFWPYLWPDPVGRLIESILNCAHYPDAHLTLFKGEVVEAEHTPRSYFPLLLTLQLTETMLICMIPGVFATLKRSRWDLLALILIWFALPAGALIWMHMNLYDNFRQVFFLLPPLFLLAGVGLEWFFARIRRPILRALVLLLVLLPGFYANMALYPYQYVYYNQLAGGIRGAYRVFELDYWHLGFKEAQAYINQTAGVNANIFAGNSKPNAQTFARPDLVFNAFGGRKCNWEKYDYLIVSTSENSDMRYSEIPTVFVVEVGNVPLAYVKKPR